jgi:hypothetical protein
VFLIRILLLTSCKKAGCEPVISAVVEHRFIYRCESCRTKFVWFDIAHGLSKAMQSFYDQIESEELYPVLKFTTDLDLL